jgi:hypothetical protein
MKMAVFYDTGGGDIYAGPTKEAVLALMKEEAHPDDFDESAVFEVPGYHVMNATDENETPTGELITLDEEYGDDTATYCIASENC